MDDRDHILVNLVEQHKHIYDKNSTLFKEKSAVDSSWSKIAACMSTTADDCQRRWCVLRNRYARERRELLDKPDISRKPWPLMAHLSFLEAHVKRRRSYRQYDFNGSITENHGLVRENQNSVTENQYLATENQLVKNLSTSANAPMKFEEIVIDEDEDDDDDIIFEEPEPKQLLSEQSNTSSCFTNDEISIFKTSLVQPKVKENALKIVSCEANFKENGIVQKQNADTSTAIKSADSEIHNNNDDSNMHFCLSLRNSLDKIPEKYLNRAKIEILQILDKYQNTT